MDFSLSDDQRAFQDAARAFARHELAPHAADWDAESIFPREVIARAGELGFCGLYTPETYGGLGLSRLDAAIVFEELAAGCTSTTAYITIHNMVSWMFATWARPEVAERWAPFLASGEKLGSYCLTEPNAGSDAANLRTRAERRGDRYVLNGSKMWITNGGDADTLVVYAKTDVNAGPRGITAFLIEKDFKGFSAGSKLDKLGMRGSNTYPLFFDECEVPEENVLGQVGEGVKVLMSGLDYERAVLAAGPLGIMQACMDITVPYLKERQQFGEPIGNFQLMQGKLADMYVSLSASRAYVYAVGQALDRGEGGRQVRKDAAGVILYAAERATQMALDTIQCLGGNGYINDYPAGRLLRDAKLYEIGAGTSEIRRWLIGRELMAEQG